MKRLFYLLLLALLPIGIMAQNHTRPTNKKARAEKVQRSSIAAKASAKSNDKIFENPEVQASFPGGQDALINWLKQNVRYPEDAKREKIEGRVIMQFNIEKDGSITGVKVVKGIAPSLDKEATRVVNAMPKWNPAQHNGNNVRCKYIMPISFKM